MNVGCFVVEDVVMAVGVDASKDAVFVDVIFVCLVVVRCERVLCEGVDVVVVCRV